MLLLVVGTLVGAAVPMLMAIITNMVVAMGLALGGVFSIVGVWRWNPADFLGSYILPLTADSNVLQEFGGGDIRLANRSIGWIVRTIGAGALPGIPVRVR